MKYLYVLIKIEPNTVLRGNVFPTCQRDISSEVENGLGIPAFVSMTCLSKAETYGGKIIAALDRQHPRDIFDVKLLLDEEGFDNETRTGFVIYLAGHNRPMNEVLNPQPIDFHRTYENEFSGMTKSPITFDELLQARANLFRLIPEILTDKERQFLIAVKKGKPDWGLLPVNGIEKLPAIQWKLKNIERLEKNKHALQLEALKRILE